MPAAPKPTKQERLSNKTIVREELKAYRQQQAMAAIERDNNCCAFHWFLLGRVVPREDIHHVFGRGRKAGDAREHYTNLLCTCRACHPQPIFTPVPDDSMLYILEVLRLANNTPMNLFFRKENYE